MIHNSNQLSVYCDGGSRGNPGPSACAFVVKNKNGKILHQEGKFLGLATNNIAEYNAVLLALKYLKNNPQLVTRNSLTNFYLDSSLVVNQINGIFKVKNSNLRNLLLTIHSQLLTINSKFLFSHVSREKNYEADLIVNQTLDLQNK